jgi:tRNA(His) 5'-end guanylyltransferase
LLGHINNLYNTTFWTLIQQGGMGAKEAETELAVSVLYVLWTYYGSDCVE